MATTFVCQSQSGIKIRKDSIVINTFFGKTNDKLYWNGKKYNCSASPLNILKGYKRLYSSTMCFNTYEGFVDDKNYAAIWLIIDDCLYLCDVTAACDDDVLIKIKDYAEGFNRNLTFYDLFLIRMIPLERLTGKKLQKKFPAGIYKYPLGSGNVFFADWFNGTIDIKSQSSRYYTPYQRLEFKAGRVVSIQNMVYYEWETIKKTLPKNKIPPLLKRIE